MAVSMRFTRLTSTWSRAGLRPGLSSNAETSRCRIYLNGGEREFLSQCSPRVGATGTPIRIPGSGRTGFHHLAVGSIQPCLVNHVRTTTMCKVWSAKNTVGALGRNTLTKPIACLHRASFSTSSVCGSSEEDRISRAYLQQELHRSPQKHDGNRLIYEVKGQRMLRVVTLSFYATAAVGLYLAPDFITSAMENEAWNQETVTNLMGLGFAVIGLPAILRILSKRLVLKLYHNEARESYLAVTQSLLLTNKMTKFSLEDVVVKKKKGLFMQLFDLTSFKAQRNPLFVNAYNFKLPSDYNHLLGYDIL